MIHIAIIFFIYILFDLCSGSGLKAGSLRGCSGVAEGLPGGMAQKTPGKCLERSQNIRIKPYSYIYRCPDIR